MIALLKRVIEHGLTCRPNAAASFAGPPGAGQCVWKGSEDTPSDESLSLGLEQTEFQSPAAGPTSCIRFLQPLGRDPHGQTSSLVAEKLQAKAS